MKLNGPTTLLHKTEVVDNNLNPEWKEFSLKVRLKYHISSLLILPSDLSGGDVKHGVVRFEVFDDEAVTSGVLIGAVEVPFPDILYMREWALINDAKKKKKKDYMHSGILVLDCEIVPAKEDELVR